MPRLRKDKIDANQPAIVKALRKITGVQVELGKDDILVGYKGRTFWYEIKDPDSAFNKDGSFKQGALKDYQKNLDANWSGHYKIVWTLQMILEDMGII